MTVEPIDPLALSSPPPERDSTNRVPGIERWLPKSAQDVDRPYQGDPWEKQPDETSAQFAKFAIYRDLDPDIRSLSQAAQRWADANGKKLTTARSHFSKLSAQHRWVERVEAFDSRMDAKLRRKLERKRLKAAERHAKQAEDFLEVVTAPSTVLAERWRKKLAEEGVTGLDGMDDVLLMKLVDALGKHMGTAQKAERDALGSVSGGGGQDIAVIKRKSEVLRAIVGNQELHGIVERATLEISQEVPSDDD